MSTIYDSGDLKSENQGSRFWHVVCDHNMHQTGHLIFENASKNYTTILWIKQYRTSMHIDFNPVERQLRCLRHVINLALEALIWPPVLVPVTPSSTPSSQTIIFPMQRLLHPGCIPFREKAVEI